MRARIFFSFLFFGLLAIFVAPVPLAWADHVPFLVPTRTIYPGQIISDIGLSEKKFYIRHQAISLYVTDINQVMNKVAKRTLVAGKPIAVAAIAAPILIERGQSVRLVYSANGLMITSLGIAIEPGSAGDIIKLRNADSGVTVSGQVQEDGSVEVGV